MPLGDRTGPAGLGPMTGRGAGYCAGYSVPGYMNRGPGRGFGRGWGRGFGWGRGLGWRRAAYSYVPDYGYGVPYPAYPERISPEEEANMLAEESRVLENELEAIKKRIKDLETKPKK
ncbi:DUF5320 domain-containing protein [candidate division WOR-3 bacterium]|nr:DUF5320 domain-containing protein [candidate division WOR-3 bacterium]